MSENKEVIDLSNEQVEKIELDDSKYNLELISETKTIEIKFSQDVFFALVNFLKE
jgi:hypothetical protein